MKCNTHKTQTLCNKYPDECLWFDATKACEERGVGIVRQKVKIPSHVYLKTPEPPTEPTQAPVHHEEQEHKVPQNEVPVKTETNWFSWFWGSDNKNNDEIGNETDNEENVSREQIQPQLKKTKVKINKLSEWKQAVVNLQNIGDWNLHKDDIFDTDDITLVLPVTNNKTNVDAILKASYSDPGRIINEANYINDLTSKGKRLFKINNGFPKVYEQQSRFPIKLEQKTITVGYYIMEKLGPSLDQIARNSKTFQGFKNSIPIFGGFKLGQVALIAQNIIRRLQIMHTPERSLGLTHNDIKPGNILANPPDDSFYLIDLDVAEAISSVVVKGKTKHVQGSYEFSGTDALLRFRPCPKSDLDALSQLIVWCATGNLPWQTDKKDMNGLAIEKDNWRKIPYNSRPGLGPLKDSKPFEDYFKYVDSLSVYSRAISDSDKVDYDYMYHLFDNIADKKISI